MAKKILLTGGSGFIGRNIVERLGGSYEISFPARAELDLSDQSAVEGYFKDNDFDVVIHAANVGGTRKTAGMQGVLDTNLKCFMNVAKCSSHFGKMIQLGSGAEYGKDLPIVRAREEEWGKRVPQDEYGLYKYKCSQYIEEAQNMVCLRLFGCFGKYEDYETRFISNAICRSLYGLPITIANKNVVFSYLYVNDFARVLAHFIEKEARYKSYNVVPDETADLLSIARKVNEISGSSLPIVVKNPGMGNEYSGGNSRLREEMPGFKFTPMEQSIRELYQWYSQNKEAIDGKKLGF
jgi:UDP-glucose 4-epimerase